MRLRPDNVLITSFIDTYLNYDTIQKQLLISGAVANGATATFSVSIPYARNKTRADIYAKNLNNGEKRPISGGRRQSPYIPKSTETCDVSATYSGKVITVTFSIFNGTGASITLTSQTIEITVVLIEVPY